MKTEIKNLDKSQIQINFELDEQEFKKYIDKALDHFKGHVKMDGFRPGNVPKEMVEKKVKSEDLLMEASDIAVKESYTKFVNENSLEPIGSPEVKILKVAKGSPFVFEVIVSVLPEITLPEYKELAKTVESQEVSVSEKEIEDSLKYLQRSRAKFTDKGTGVEYKDYVKISYQNDSINGGKELKDIFIVGEGAFLKDFEENLIGMKVGEEKEFNAKFPENAPQELAGKEGKFKVKMMVVQTMELPEINDAFAKELGAFENLEALKENIKEGVTVEKQEAERQRKRGELLNIISKKINFDLPEKMVEYEQARMLEDLKNQVASQFKISFEDYLTSVKKTEEELKKSFAAEAERRIKNFLVLKEIGTKEEVKVSREEIEEEMNKFTKSYSKEQIEKIDIKHLKEYIESTIYNEKVFQLIEKFSQVK